MGDRKKRLDWRLRRSSRLRPWSGPPWEFNDSKHTALAYGEGHSERLVGQLTRERSETIYVATKIPPKNHRWPAQSGVSVAETFPAAHVIACTEVSLKNLGLETIDVQQFHVWSDEWVNQGNWLEAVQKLKKEGKLRYFGVSINDFGPKDTIKLIETGVVDTVQVIYNIFEQSPEDQLFPACERHQVGVIVRVALDEGGLTGKITPDTTFEASDFRSRYFRGDRKQQVYERVQKIASDLNIRSGPDGRNSVALCPGSPGRIYRHTGNAFGKERGTELPGGRRTRTTRRTGGEIESPSMGPQFLRMNATEQEWLEEALSPAT